MAGFKPEDRERLWKDTLGAGSWRSIRAVIYAFEALERWARDYYPNTPLYPMSVNTAIQYILDRETHAKDGKCPPSLPSTIRTAITTTYKRLMIAPMPDFDGNPIWQALVKRIRQGKVVRDPKDLPRPMPRCVMIALENKVIDGFAIEALFAGLFLWTVSYTHLTLPTKRIV